MKIKIEVLTFLKAKKQVIGWWLLLPGFVLLFQMGGLIFINPVYTGAQATEGISSVDAKPMVLGASISTRGSPEADIKKPLPVSPDFKSLPSVTAKSYLVYDLTDSAVIAQKLPDAKLPIASLTKLMTGLLAYNYLNFTDQIVIDKQNLTAVKPSVDFVNGDKVAIGDVFKAMIVGSCNNAAQVLGRELTRTSGKDVAELMNDKAKELGMSGTSFSNPIGFDSVDNFSTAGDLLKLVKATQALSAFTNLGQTSSVAFSGADGVEYRVSATNKLISSHPDIQAVKTGFTESSQGSMITKVIKDGNEVVIIVLNSENREKDTLLLKSSIVDNLKWE